MKKMRKNNKGFSLVELIVVIAIMAILAVTLAPRLSQYVEKSRKASDQEAINTIFTAAKLANLEDPVEDGYSLNLSETDGLYTVTAEGKTWTLDDTYTEVGKEEFFKTLIEIIGDFKLKSSDVVAGTKITIDSDATTGKLSVTLDYDGVAYEEADDYKVSE